MTKLTFNILLSLIIQAKKQDEGVWETDVFL